jgi:hypothetical protein
MGKVVAFMSMSLDGFVADAKGRSIGQRRSGLQSVDPRGFEPLTSWLPAKRSTS